MRENVEIFPALERETNILAHRDASLTGRENLVARMFNDPTIVSQSKRRHRYQVHSAKYWYYLGEQMNPSSISLRTHTGSVGCGGTPLQMTTGVGGPVL